MPQITLDAGANPPVGVATPQQIAVYVGTTPRQLLIFTGVAIANWDSQSNLDREEVIVRLGATTTPNFEATAVVGLASIYNEDSDFTFASRLEALARLVEPRTTCVKSHLWCIHPRTACGSVAPGFHRWTV